MSGGRSKPEIAVTGFLARKLGGPLLAAAQRMRRDQLESLTPPIHSFVLLGDSITEYGEWEELLVGMPVVNRGIGGETSAQLLERLPAALNEPRAVALLIGTNDLALGVPAHATVRNVGEILDRIEHLAPGTPVLLQSIMPRSRRFASEVRAVNERLQTLVRNRTSVEYLDLWPALSDGADEIRAEYSLDRLHLTGAGYRAWIAVLRPALERVGLAVH